MQAYSGGVYCFQFHGDLTYIDPYDSSVWNWEDTDNSIEEVLAVTQDDGKQLVFTINLSDCISLQGSFFWDDTDGVLYVHWYRSAGDFSVSKQAASYSQIVAGYSSDYSDTNRNVFDGVFYDSILTGISGLGKSVDPTKLGLVSYTGGSFTLANEDGQFDDIEANQYIGAPVWFYYAPDDATELTRAMRIFTGFISSYNNDRSDITFNIIETRLYENKPICKNTISIDNYPDVDKNDGKFIPVAFGDIRRGILLPTNQGAVSEIDPFTITFLVADPENYSVLSIDAVYDQNNVEFTIDSFDLAACTVTISSADKTGTQAEFAEQDFSKWAWEGKGYDIDGTYNNGLDMIKAGYLKFANIPFLTSRSFDLSIKS